MPFLQEMDQTGGFVAPIPKSFGAELATTYAEALPFPHVVIDDFMPSTILDMCIANFPDRGDGGAFTHNKTQERNKTQYQPDFLNSKTRSLFYAFNSLPFIRIIENITGIQGLIPDPYFMGAGFHSIQNGGFLEVHADFNHHKPMDLERRVNVLIYMNKEWGNEYGGELELWDANLHSCCKSIAPHFNRCVIFNTTSNSFHGNPKPVNNPLGISRKSIALYYYTATWDDAKKDHSTMFRTLGRGSRAIDSQPWAKTLIRNWTPPIIQRAIVNQRKGKNNHQGRRAAR